MRRPLLKDSYPELEEQLVDESLRGKLTSGSNRKVLWRGSCGHEWMAHVANRVNGGGGCPYCSGAKVLPGFNDLNTTHPDLAGQLVDERLGSRLSRGSMRKVLWRCGKGHEWSATVNSRTSMGSGCPYCVGKRAIPGETDLATTHPDLAAELADPSLATELSAGSRRRVAWRCSKGHEWVAEVDGRTGRGRGCPYCAGQAVLKGYNDLATTHPELAAELANREDAVKVSYGSRTKVMWRCKSGHEWAATPNSRVAMGSGCPYCSGRMAWPGFNDLATTHPDLAAELVDAGEAATLRYGSNRVVRWRCSHGHEWSAKVRDRAIGGYGCPHCSSAGSSSMEREMVGFLESLVGRRSVKSNYRKLIPPEELDAVVPEAHVAVEFNGCYWHSEGAGKAPSYHKDKLERCEAAGYRLIQVWEDDWRTRRAAVEHMLEAKLGVADGAMGRVFARKLAFGCVRSHDAASFLDANHVQGRVSATAHFGLFEGDELVALVSVRSPRANGRARRRPGEWEVQRYATSKHVVGGFSKLLANAERILLERGETLTRWVSFSSNDVSDGGMYEACGFELDAELPPDYKYVGDFTGWTRMPKERFQRKRFRDDPGLEWDESWTEHEAALANGLYRVYDSGKRRWVREVPR